MSRFFSSKKADLNMSIQAIVVIVLAMTLLGLGIGFIRNQFASLTETTGSVQEQIKQQILDDLRTGDKKLSFPATEIQLSRGKSTVIAIGVKNTGISTLVFGINMTCTSEGTATIPTTFYNKAPDAFTLLASEAQVYPIKVTASSTDTGNYICSVKVIDNANPTGTPYAQKDFFIVVG
jgi:hypothetical protein